MKSVLESKTIGASMFSLIVGVALLSKNPAVVTVATVMNDPSVQAQLLLIGGGIVHTILRLVTKDKVVL